MLKKTLLFLEKKTRTDVRYFVKGGFWIGLENVSAMAASLISGIALANIFDKADYGTYKFIFSLIGTLMIFTIRGLGTAIVQAVAKSDNNALDKGVAYQIRWGFIYVLACFIVASYYLMKDSLVIGISLLILGIFTPLITAFRLYRSYLAGKKDFKQSAIYVSVEELTTAILTVAALLIFNNVIFLIAVFAFVEAIQSFLFYLATKKKYQSKPLTSVSDEGFKNYARHLTIVEIFNVIARQLDSIILFGMKGPETLALYAIAQTFPNNIYTFLKSLSGTFLPKLSEKNSAEVSRIFYRRLFQTFIIGAAVGIVYALIASTLFQIIFPKYPDAVIYSRMLAIDMALGLSAGFIGAVFFSQKLIRGIYTSTILGTIVRLILYITLGLTMGIAGMVTAYIISRIINIIINIFIWEIEKSRLLGSNHQ